MIDPKKCSVCLEDMESYKDEDKHEHKVRINDVEYTYSPYYDRLQVEQEENETPIVGSIRCVRCHNDSFRISYGNYECIANCTCGHSFTIYDG